MMYKVNELVKKSNFSKETIRYYESIDLISPVKRDVNNYRLYSDDTLERLSYIQVGKKLGFTLKEIKMILEEDLYTSSVKDVFTLVSEKANEVMIEIERLQKQLNMLTEIKKKLKSPSLSSCSDFNE